MRLHRGVIVDKLTDAEMKKQILEIVKREGMEIIPLLIDYALKLKKEHIPKEQRGHQ